jgi:cyclic pyranopterin phosphate synthase
VSDKKATKRVAVAQATVALAPATLRAIVEGAVAKGDALAAARLAGIMAAKKTPELIPLCHPLPLSEAAVDFEIDEARSEIVVVARAAATAPTGVEMEALTAAATAALTIYDMCKALQKDITIRELFLREKTGGKSGDYRREQ